ncbi:MAG: cupredoxin domain-containing protein [Microcoleaceae cyanobacterium]
MSLSILSHDKISLSAPEIETNTQFQKVEQPFGIKGIVTAAGLGLIVLELWWFKGSQTQAKSAESQAGIQEIKITVDGGYQPNHIVVNIGQPVRLNFERRDTNSCLEEIQLPEFKIKKKLPLNQTTSVEFTPETPGSYEFACGMNMFRGIIEVKSI